MSTPQAVKNVGTRFRRFRDVDDINMIDMLRCKAEMELHETLLGFKTRSHVLKALEPWRDTKIAVPASLVQSSRHVSPFLQKFYYGLRSPRRQPAFSLHVSDRRGGDAKGAVTLPTASTHNTGHERRRWRAASYNQLCIVIYVIRGTPFRPSAWRRAVPAPAPARCCPCPAAPGCARRSNLRSPLRLAQATWPARRPAFRPRSAAAVMLHR